MMRILRDMGRPVPPEAQDPSSPAYERWLAEILRESQPRSGAVLNAPSRAESEGLPVKIVILENDPRPARSR